MLASVRRVAVALSVTLSVALAAPPAWAQKKGAPAAAPVEDPKMKEARDHYQAGLTHYNLNEFDDAIKEFKQAYAISNAPGLLYNIAQAYRLNKDYASALQFYKTYLRLMPNAPNKADAEQKIAEMEKLAAENPKGGAAGGGTTGGTTGAGTGGTTGGGTTGGGGDVKPDDKKPGDVASNTGGGTGGTGGTAVVKPDATHVTVDSRPKADGVKPIDHDVTPPEIHHPGKGKKLAGLVTGLGGVALIGTGAYFGTQAASKAGTITDLSTSHGQWTSSAADTYSSGQSDQVISEVMYVVGGVALIGGGVLYYLGIKSDKEANQGSSVAVVPGHGGGGEVVVTWSF